MARTHGRIASVIWNDDDFLALDAEAQRLYLFLLSQPDLSHAGLLPLRERRWAKKVNGGTPASISDALRSLADERFILLDEDSEEVLIRTFVRNDGVWKQPKVMIRMREDARLIESPRLREAFAIELDRIPLDELSDEGTGPHHEGPSTRSNIAGIVEQIKDDFAAAYPSERVSGRVSDTPRVGARAFPLPPTPVPRPPSPDQTSVSSEVADATSRPDERPEVEAILDRLEAGIAANDAKVPTRSKKARDAIRLMLDRDKRTPDSIYAAIEYATTDEFWRANILSAAKLREKFDQLRLSAQRSNWRPTDRHQRDADFWENEMAVARAMDESAMREIES